MRTNISFKDYESHIKERVSKIKDDNWEWSVKSISDDTVKIKWGYLTDLGENNDSFILKLYADDSCFDDEMIMSARDPRAVESINCEMVSEKPTKSWQSKVENAIISLIEDIADYAHSRY